MIDISNSAEMSQYLQTSSQEAVKFPFGSNILLGYGQVEEVGELESLASMARRCLHLC